MSQTNSEARSFRVHARHVDAHHARTFSETSSEAAALAYIETLHDLPAETDDIRVIVLDVESGREHCFRIDLDGSGISNCG